MGMFDKMKEAAAERRRAADLAARKRAEADAATARQRAEADAAKQAEQALDPEERINQPAWVLALKASGIEPTTIQAALDGDGGTIFSPGNMGMGMPNMRHINVGVVVLTTDDSLAYAFRSDSGLEVIVRRRSEVSQMRRANSGHSVQVVFENDRSFPDRGGQIGRADHWDLRARTRDPNAIRAVFLTAGYEV